MPELPPNVSGEPVLSEHIMQAARSICPGAPASVPYDDLDVDARHALVSTYVRDFHKWAITEHEFMNMILQPEHLFLHKMSLFFQSLTSP